MEKGDDFFRKMAGAAAGRVSRRPLKQRDYAWKGGHVGKNENPFDEKGEWRGLKRGGNRAKGWGDRPKQGYVGLEECRSK